MHYSRLDDHLTEPPLINPARAVGLVLTCLVTWSGLSRLAPLLLPSSAEGRGRTSKAKIPWKPFLPTQGVEEVLIAPGPIGPAAVASTLHIFCYFSYGPLREQEEQEQQVALSRIWQEGWVYGASLLPNSTLAVPTGQTVDILKGRLACWTPLAFPVQLSAYDKRRNYLPDHPQRGSLRRGIVQVVKKDGSSASALWHYKEGSDMLRPTPRPRRPDFLVDMRGFTADQILDAAVCNELDVPCVVAAWFLLGQSVRREPPSAAYEVRTDPRFMQLLQRVTQAVPFLTPIKLANCWLGARDLLVEDPPLLEALQLQTINCTHRLDSQALSNVLSSLATLVGSKWTAQPSFQQLLKAEAIGKVRFFKAQEIATTFICLAKLGVPIEEKEYDLLCNHVLRTADTFLPQNIGFVLDAVAILHYPTEPKMLDALYDTSLRIVSSFEARDIATVLGAMERLDHRPGKTLLKALCDEALSKADGFKSAEIVTLLSAVVEMDFPPGQTLLTVMCQEVAEKAVSFTAAGVANFLSAMARLSFYPGDSLLRTMCGEALKQVPAFTVRQIATTLDALASLSFDPGPAVLQAFTRETEKQIGKCVPQDASEILHAACFFGFVDVVFFPHLLTFLSVSSADSWAHSVYYKLQFVSLSLHWEFANLGLLMPAAVAQACISHLTLYQQQGIRSAFQTEVSELVTEELGWTGFGPDASLGLQLDLALPAQKVAVEAEEPSHFLVSVDSRRRHKGTMIYKQRLLRAMGWLVVPVPFFQWESWNLQERARRLEQELTKAAVKH
eukprot:gb/GEZN01002508.1/.p1 GENE.gb/GEZN01002508.1/~~gb/GEZN01002508.1/.p1  ORF type:complete len:784 (+),score=97.76 gb/GEZN01002508.1/:29-2380(+)